MKSSATGFLILEETEFAAPSPDELVEPVEPTLPPEPLTESLDGAGVLILLI